INRKTKYPVGINVIHKILAAFLFCTNVISLGQTSAKPLVLVKAGRLFDARSGRFVQNQGILIEGDRIKEVGDTATVSSHAAGAKTIDLSTKTVLPGLIDCHAHILSNPKDYSPTRDLRMSSPQAVLWGYHNVQIWLAHGFTTLRDAG